MADRPYHHGNLRAVLLDAAERTLREQGLDRLSLRELARQAGVSHAAPRRHFADRRALLDALAETGFARLGDRMRAAIEGAGPDVEAQLHAAATAYIRFAVDDGPLLDLMFANKNADPPAAPPEGALRLFGLVGELIVRGQRAGALPPGDPERLRLLLVATLQGIAALVTSGRAPAEQTGALVADAVALFTGAWTR